MYRTCLYCSGDLGSNDILETLPIGRRVAFDGGRGRLWVVCRACEKWNLVPFDTRLETIDTCERLFTGARLRFSTDHIGIARLTEGLELVRIGAAQRPEFAAWRYGDQFGRRRWRYGVRVAGLAVAGVAVAVGGTELARLAGFSGGVGFQLVNPIRRSYMENRVVVRIETLDDEQSIVTNQQLHRAAISYVDHWWSLFVPVFGRSRLGYGRGEERIVKLHGPMAVEALGRLLPRLNAAGGTRRTIRDAVALLEERPDGFRTPLAGRLKEMDRSERLALEMSAHEDTERTALAGELKLLEREWRRADELAAIADSLAISDDVNARFESPDQS